MLFSVLGGVQKGMTQSVRGIVNKSSAVTSSLASSLVTGVVDTLTSIGKSRYNLRHETRILDPDFTDSTPIVANTTTQSVGLMLQMGVVESITGWEKSCQEHKSSKSWWRWKWQDELDQRFCGTGNWRGRIAFLQSEQIKRAEHRTVIGDKLVLALEARNHSLLAQLSAVPLGVTMSIMHERALVLDWDFAAAFQSPYIDVTHDTIVADARRKANSPAKPTETTARRKLLRKHEAAIEASALHRLLTTATNDSHTILQEVGREDQALCGLLQAKPSTLRDTLIQKLGMLESDGSPDVGWIAKKQALSIRQAGYFISLTSLLLSFVVHLPSSSGFSASSDALIQQPEEASRRDAGLPGSE
eukprot:gene1931-2615_t